MKYSITAVKAIILNQGNKILSIEQNINGFKFLDLPGGKMNSDESPEEALNREVEEETGLDIDIGECLGPWWFQMKKDPEQQIVCLTYTCRLRGEDQVVSTTNNPSDVEKKETEKMVWLTKEEFLRPEYHKNRENSSLTDLVKKLHL